MSISGLNPDQLALSALNQGTIQGLTGTQGLQGTAVGTQAIATNGDQNDSVGSASSIQISPQAQLYSKLQQLQQSNPTEYKQLLTNAASQLTAAAQSATGQDQQFLTNLANKFTQAANGDLAALAPTQQSGQTTTQSSQSTLNSQALAAYTQNTTQSPSALDALTGSSSSGTQATGEKSHHHSRSSAAQQALSQVFQQLNSALGLTTSGSGSGTSTTTTPTTTPTASTGDAD
jgi:hypothetical protein